MWGFRSGRGGRIACVVGWVSGWDAWGVWFVQGCCLHGIWVFWLGEGEEAHVLSLVRRVLGVLWETAVRLAISSGPSGARARKTLDRNLLG